MFAKGYKERRIVIKNPIKRAAYTNLVYFKPTSKELTLFQEFQRVIYKKLMLYHPDPDRQLFL